MEEWVVRETTVGGPRTTENNATHQIPALMPHLPLHISVSGLPSPLHLQLPLLSGIHLLASDSGGGYLQQGERLPVLGIPVISLGWGHF